MEKLYQNKKAVIAITVLVLAFFAYSVIMSPDATSLTDTTRPGEDLVKVAQNLSAINFNQEIFKTPSYRSLIDWSPIIPSEPTGRVNPFDVIGRN